MDWTREKIEERKSYIGGSDASAILGINRYKSPLSVWAIKTKQIVPPNIDDVVAVKLGVKLEQTVAEFFMEETGKKVERVNKTLTHPRYDFLRANIDRKVIGEDAGLECKTTNQFKAREWEDNNAPVEYIIQCTHYMAVTGCKKWYLAVLIGNTQFKWLTIDRDNKVINDLVKKEVDFWNRFIVTKQMPMQISSQDSSILYALYPQAAPESIIELDDKAQQICEFRDSALVDLKSLKLQVDEYSNTLKAMLATHETGMTARYKITWKNQPECRLDTALLKKEEPAIYEKYAPKKEKRVLRVAVRKLEGR
ncbi:hypothetical protein D4R71_00460 [bacterium]|nr:MAG: hypothetical protein D4R71_00460 [bacterium]